MALLSCATENIKSFISNTATILTDEFYHL